MNMGRDSYAGLLEHEEEKLITQPQRQVYMEVGFLHYKSVRTEDSQWYSAVLAFP